ncbi:single-stranded DNA-binding protein [Pelagibius marinus]|uniref:single-stranded DNA-binding protein n=1 Tax=Pelagibius marinus TaxID=2762760 RepID=UPI001872EAD6|nr:single-stranded DNA-binding protein [Pelagibius marinus]
MINNVTLLGRLGADAEIRETKGGEPVANFRVATSEVWLDKESGEWKERVEWHQIAAFGKGLVALVEKHGTKGNLIFLQGQLRTRSYEKDGQKHYSTEVILGRDAVVRFPERKMIEQGSEEEAA